jgi:hypothetical protein
MKRIMFFVAVIFPLTVLISKATNTDSDTLWTSRSGSTTRLVISPNDSLLIVYTDGAFDFDSVLNGHLIKFYDGLNDPIFTPDGRYIVGYKDTNIIILRTDSLIVYKQYHSPLYILGVEISSNGSRIYTYPAPEKGIGYSVWDFSTGQKLEDAILDSCNEAQGGEYGSLAFSDSLNIVYAAYNLIYQNYPKNLVQKRCTVFDMTTKQKKYDVDTTAIVENYIDGLNTILSRDRKILFELGPSFFIRRDFATGNIMDTLQIPNLNQYRASAYSVSNDNKYLILPAYRELQIWNLQTKNKIYTYSKKDSACCYDISTISNNNKYIATTSRIYLYKTPWLSTGIIREHSDKNELNIIYPNPADSRFKSEFFISKPGFTKLTIRNIQGILIREISGYFDNPGNNTIEIDTKDIPNGAYYLEIETQEGRSTSRVVINR